MSRLATIIDKNHVELNIPRQGKFLQSYKSIVAMIPYYSFIEGEYQAVVYPKWDYSKTTTKHVSAWLHLTPKEIREGIKNGTIKYEECEPNI